MVEFPAEVEIPIKLHYIELAAIMIANISSCPGSQSSQILIFYNDFSRNINDYIQIITNLYKNYIFLIMNTREYIIFMNF